MIYVAIGCYLVFAGCVYALRRHYQRAVALSYFEGFRDGVMYEAKANHASAPRIAAVRVPLSGVN